MLPTGTSIIKSSPVFPFLFLLNPDPPFSARKVFLFLKSTSVFKLSVALINMEPPSPPSPPSGPPSGTYFSLLKLRQPLPPLPAFTKILVSSINFILKN